MASPKRGKLYVMFAVSDPKNGWLSSPGMKPPLPEGWSARPQCGIRPRDALFPRSNVYSGPLDKRGAARAGVEKHLLGLLKRGKLARFKVLFGEPKA
jgi:hypothetical protein